MFTPSRTAASTSAARRVSAASSAPSPSARRYTARKTCVRNPTRLMEQMRAKLSASSSGRGSRTSRQEARESSSRLPWLPRYRTVEVTMCSRKASIGGFVTWANSW